MNSTAHAGHDSTPAGSDFRTTHWSIVLAAGDSTSPKATAALEKLCRTYWYPLYVYVRRRGYGEHDAQDLAQGYFAQLLRRNAFREVTPGPSRFRSFLLTAMKNFLADEHARATALKRGGGQALISFDAHEAEQRYQLEPVDGETPERLFDQRWAVTLLNTSLLRLEQDFSATGRTPLFKALAGYIIEGKGAHTYAEIAIELSMTEEAVKKSAQRLRRRFQEIIREEIARTVASSTEVEEELNYLWSAIGKG